MRLVAWLLLGITGVAALLFLWPGPAKSPWLVLACALAAVGTVVAFVIAGYLGPLRPRPWLYLLLPAASMGGQSMFLFLIIGAIAAQHVRSGRIQFNVSWPVLIVASVLAYLALALLTRRLRERWHPYPEIVAPLVQLWMAVNLLAVEIGFGYLRSGEVRLLGFVPNALPHLIMGSLGFWLFAQMAGRADRE